MSVVRNLRSQLGLTQIEFASRVGTSQSTLAAYESGSKTPNLATLRRMGETLGLNLAVNFVRPLTREDRKSLAFSAANVRAILADYSGAIKLARRNLSRAKMKHPGARRLLEEWESWLVLPVQDLVSRMMDYGMRARDMRQVAPFAGLLTHEERSQVLRSFKKEEKRESR